MADISGYGLSVRIVASNSFPAGFEITQFADDADPLDLEEIEISGSAMGLNGDLVTWVTPNPLPMKVNVITGSEDDRNLQVLFEANRAGRNKNSAKDQITAVVSYPDGAVTTLTGGVCKQFLPSRAVSSESRLKSNPYTFAFENRVATP